MKPARKILTACAVTAVIALSGAPSAFAFRISPPATAGSSDNNAAVAAYSSGTSKAAELESWLLSPAEIAHIKWCAQRFPSYNPTDNTYTGPKGKDITCHSPG